MEAALPPVSLRPVLDELSSHTRMPYLIDNETKFEMFESRAICKCESGCGLAGQDVSLSCLRWLHPP